MSSPGEAAPPRTGRTSRSVHPLGLAPVLGIAICASALAAGLLAAALLQRYGEWAYAGWRAQALLLGTLLCAGVLAGAAAGVALWLLLAALDRLRRRAGALGLALALVLLSFGWLPFLLATRPLSVYARPAQLAALGGGLLLAGTLARGARPWRIADAALLCCVGTLLVAALCWLNFSFLRLGADATARGSNAALLGAAHLLVALGVRASGRLGVHAAPTRAAPRLLRLLLAALVAAAAFGLARLPRAARSGVEPLAVAPVAALAPAAPAQPLAASAPADAAPPPPRNVVLLSLDTLRPDHLGIYGHPRATSPNLDRFFADGVVFANAWAPAPWTLPSHASLLTGQPPSAHGARAHPSFNGGFVDRLPEPVVTLAERLAEAGFATAAFTGGSYVSALYGLDQGFATFHETRSRRMDEVLDAALPWLEARAGEPFFLFLHSYDAHGYNPPRSWPDLPDPTYRGPLLALRSGGPDQLESLVVADAFRELAPADLRYLESLYDAEIRGLDLELARLFRRLESLALLDRTAVIVTSDHGEDFGEHGGVGHGFRMRETALRVPLLVSAPGFRSGRRVEAPARLVDVAPTVLALAGVASAPGAMQGTSLLPALAGGATGVVAILMEADMLDQQAALIAGPLKYVHHGVPGHDPLALRFLQLSLRGLLTRYGSGEELFDLARDPGERHDLAAREPAQARRLRGQLFASLRALREAGAGGQEGRTRLSPQLEESLRAMGYLQ